MKIQWQWPGAMVFAVVFVSVATLVYFGKVPDVLLGGLLAWLIPSPMAHREPARTVVVERNGLADN